MKKYVDLLFESITKRDASLLPMAERYAATENGKPAAVCHMTSWRTITGVNCIGHLICDKVEGQVVVVADVDEGGKDSLFSARMKIAEEKITELEIYLLRSRAEAGFWFAAKELAALPEGWSAPIPEGGRASRDELLELAKAAFDPRGGKMYMGAPDNYGMENGGVVREHIDYITAMVVDSAPPIDMSKVPESGRVCTPLPMLFPVRPFDPNARVQAIDEEQGIVVSFGMVDGYVSPYIVADEVSTCFVPEAMIEDHRRTLTPERTAGKSLLKEMKATGMTTQIMRYHSGKLHGVHQIIVLTGYGSRSVWNDVT